MKGKILTILTIIITALFSVVPFVSGLKASDYIANFTQTDHSQMIASGWSVPPPDEDDPGTEG